MASKGGGHYTVLICSDFTTSLTRHSREKHDNQAGLAANSSTVCLAQEATRGGCTSRRRLAAFSHDYRGGMRGHCDGMCGGALCNREGGCFLGTALTVVLAGAHSINGLPRAGGVRRGGSR